MQEYEVILNEIKSKKKKWIKGGCGIYFLFDKNELVYIGQSINCLSRIAEHENCKKFDSYYILKCEREQLSEIEAVYIERYKPRYNSQVPSTKKDSTAYERYLKLKRQKDIKQMRIEGYEKEFNYAGSFIGWSLKANRNKRSTF